MWYLLYNLGMKHQPILDALKQQIEMEKNLSYGDSFNFIGSVSHLFQRDLEKVIDLNLKKD